MTDRIEFRRKHLESIGFHDEYESPKLNHYKYFIWAPDQIEWNKIEWLIGTTSNHAEQIAMVECTPPEHLDNVLLRALKVTYDVDIIVEEILKHPRLLLNKVPTAAIYYKIRQGKLSDKTIDRIAKIISDPRANFKQGSLNSILGLICKLDRLDRTKPIYDAIVSSKFFDWNRCNCHLQLLRCFNRSNCAADAAVLLKQNFDLARDQNKCLWKALKYDRNEIASLILYDKRTCLQVNKSRLLLAAARHNLTTYYRYIFFQHQQLSMRATLYLFKRIKHWKMGQYAIMRDPTFLNVLIKHVYANHCICLLTHPVGLLCESLGARGIWCCGQNKKRVLQMQYHFVTLDVWTLAFAIQSLRLPVLLECHLAELICEPLSNSIPFSAFWTICAAVKSTANEIQKSKL